VLCRSFVAGVRRHVAGARRCWGARALTGWARGVGGSPGSSAAVGARKARWKVCCVPSASNPVNRGGGVYCGRDVGRVRRRQRRSMRTSRRCGRRSSRRPVRRTRSALVVRRSGAGAASGPGRGGAQRQAAPGAAGAAAPLVVVGVVRREDAGRCGGDPPRTHALDRVGRPIGLPASSLLG
jgi:hypothetical protein